jgi:hypothetical protein
MKRTILIGAVCALIGGAATAGAQTTSIFGNGGKTYEFDAKCHRVTFVPPGITDHEAINVVGQQVHCLVSRPDPFARCVRHLGAAPAVTLWRKDDWKGVGKLAKYVAAVSGCSRAHL